MRGAPGMRLVLESDPRLNLVRSYGEGVIVIGEQRITHPCIVTPRTLLLDWAARSVEELSEGELEPLWGLSIDILLLGAGERAAWPSAALRSALRTRAIALECMNLGAACRTYNILANEQRAVAAALFP